MLQVHICYTFKDNHERTIIQIFSEFKDAKDWQHRRARLIMKMQRLHAKYLLATSKKQSEKLFSKYYDFREKHKLYSTETPSSPFFHSWEVKEGAKP